MTKTLFRIATLVAAVALVTPVLAQEEFAPVLDPSTVGLTPLTAATPINGGIESEDDTESIGVDITSNGQIIIGWEDDGSPSSVEGIAAGIRRYNMDLTNIPWANDADDNNVSSYYKDNGDPTVDGLGWGPKIKADWFGGGFGMGSTAFGFADPTFGVESLADAQMNEGNEPGDIPGVQLYDADGAPILPVRSGVTDEFAEPAGDIRIGDFCFLSNGSIAVVGEVRQDGGNALPPMNNNGDRSLSLGILGPNDQFPAAITRLHAADGAHEMWHGVEALADGFVTRFRGPGGIALRYFENDGTPKGDELDLTVIGEDAVVAQGGRGDGETLDTNGNDRVLLVGKTNVDGFEGNEVYATVFDGAGNVVVGPIMTSGDLGDGGGYSFTNADRVGGAIGPDGSFLTLWADADPLGGDRVLMTRIFNADGTPATPIISVDDRVEDLLAQPGNARRPRAAWRGNKIVMIWESNVDANFGKIVVARVFQFGEDAAVSDFMLH